jgi:hypothetical protein
MQMPEGYSCEPGQVCRLKCSLYSLKQASRACEKGERENRELRL